MKPPRRFTLDNRGSSGVEWTRDSQAILFSSTRNGKSEIFRQGLNEKIAEAVVRGPGKYEGAGLSQDGSWVLYQESTATASRLMRRPITGGSAEMVLEEPHDAVWSYECPPKPGAACVLGVIEGSDLVYYALDLFRGKGDRLGAIAGWLFWSLSPDGSRVVVLRHKENKKQIEVLTTSDHTWHDVSVEPGWGDLGSAAWAANGNGFYLTTYSSNDTKFLYVTLAGKVKLLHNGPLNLAYARPSPNGKYLAFEGATQDSNVWLLENF
jgi:Tol biopolymer transport system component